VTDEHTETEREREREWEVTVRITAGKRSERLKSCGPCRVYVVVEN